MKKTAIAIALAAASATAIPAYAEVEISGNVSLVSDYRYRGISQTLLKPALQGGFDLTHSSGFYIGNWNSNVDSQTYTDASLEMDFYGGYATEFSNGIGIDVGVLRYQYPGNTDDPKQNSTEAYLGISYGPISYTYNRFLTKWFGVPETKGTVYHSLDLEYSLNDKVSLTAHAGNTRIKNFSEFNYKDYSVGVSYALPSDYAIGLTYYTNSFKAASKAEQADLLAAGEKETWKNAFVISLSKTF
jgi:uncharacterized protein (TIGR02001 family)